jgi:hypothetical protein
MKRGRKSMAELVIGPVTVTRLEPPYSLTNSEIEVWRMITNAMPADFFSPSHIPLMTQLCRHCVTADRIKLLIEQACRKKTIDPEYLQKWLAAQNSETSAIVRLMRSLRLSPQSVYRAESPKLRPNVITQRPSPWDRKYDHRDDGDDDDEKETS